MTDQPVPRTYSDSGEHLAMIADNLAARAVGHGLAPPSSGQHAKAEIVYNEEPIAGSPVGWVCTVAGKPGTWESFGSVKELPLTTPVTTIRLRSLFEIDIFDITGTEGISDGIQGQGDVTVAMDELSPDPSGSFSSSNITVNAAGQTTHAEDGETMGIANFGIGQTTSTTASQKAYGSMRIGADGSDTQMTINWGWTEPIDSAQGGMAEDGGPGNTVNFHAFHDPLYNAYSEPVMSPPWSGRYYMATTPTLNYAGTVTYTRPFYMFGLPEATRCPGGVYPKTWDGGSLKGTGVNDPPLKDPPLFDMPYDMSFYQQNWSSPYGDNLAGNLYKYPRVVDRTNDPPESWGSTGANIKWPFTLDWGSAVNDFRMWQQHDMRNGIHHPLYRITVNSYRYGTIAEQEADGLPHPLGSNAAGAARRAAEEFGTYRNTPDLRVAIDYTGVTVCLNNTNWTGGGGSRNYTDVHEWQVPSFPYIVIGGRAAGGMP